MALQFRRKTHELIPKDKSEMEIMKRMFLFTLLTILIISLACSSTQKQSNSSVIDDKTMEDIHSQIKAKKLSEIYENSSELLKKCLGKYQFAETMSEVVGMLEKADEDLNFKVDEFAYEIFEEKYNKDNFVKFYILNLNEKQKAVEMTTWDNTKKLVKYGVLQNNRWFEIPNETDCKDR